jgi:hypothetical protein
MHGPGVPGRRAQRRLGCRIHLGSARLIYAVLLGVAISFGPLLGLALLGVSLPVAQDSGAVALRLQHFRGRSCCCRLQRFLSPRRYTFRLGP